MRFVLNWNHKVTNLIRQADFMNKSQSVYLT